jgi:hypothetical protein
MWSTFPSNIKGITTQRVYPFKRLTLYDTDNVVYYLLVLML